MKLGNIDVPNHNDNETELENILMMATKLTTGQQQLNMPSSNLILGNLSHYN